VTQTPGTTPNPGWYPDPQHPTALRYWDGARWTEHVAPQPPQAPPPANWPEYPPGGYPAAETSVLAPSGLRRITELFSDIARILRVAWAQLILVTLLLWTLPVLVVMLVAVALIDIPKWSEAFGDLFDAIEEYSGDIPVGVGEQLGDQFEAAAESTSPGLWIAFAIVAGLGLLFVIVVHAAAVYRIGADAASGRSLTLGQSLSAAIPGGLRLLGYGVLLALAGTAVFAVFVAILIGIGALWVPGAVLLGVVGFFAFIVAAFWIMGRVSPAMVEASLPGGGGALSWSWGATQGRSWPVVGRLLLWSLAVSLVQSIIAGVIWLVMAAVGSVAIATGGGVIAGIGFVVVGLVMMVVNALIYALTYVGGVPIWRDLTPREDYRAIDDSGNLVPIPV